MKKVFIAAMLLAFGVNNSSTFAEVKKSGKTFEVTTSIKQKSEPKVTGYTYKENGVEYPIYIGSTGSCFILKTSKKTGKEYRQYLGAEISQQVCKELGIEYKSKSSK